MNNIVLFGITGDLARSRLIPTLYALFKKHELDEHVRLFGFGRKSFSKEEFISFITDICGMESQSFAQRWTYIESEIDNVKGFSELSKQLVGSALVYISLPPSFHIDVVKRLLESKIIAKGTDRKIAFEKPFGFGLKSAKELESFISKNLEQNQILRLDHYAGKETFIDLEKAGRLGILDNALSSKIITKIDVRFHEVKTAEHRGAFYDSVGALYDVGQNHVMYMLSSILALPYLHTSKKTLSAIRSEQLASVVFSKKAILKQYDSFRKEDGVKSDSVTETFFALYGKLKNKKSLWNGLDVILSAGKGLKENDVSIRLYFKGKKEPVKILVNGYGNEDAYVYVFRAALNANGKMFADFKQIETGWKIVEVFKKSIKNIELYKKGTTPKF
jgi:glucose-6-phosphate 1-dehydrogenase